MERFGTPSSSFSSGSQVAQQRGERAQTGSPGGSTAWRLGQLRAAILLGGTVRSSGFATAIKRSLMDLPIGNGTTLLSYWGGELSQLGRKMGIKDISVRMVIGRNCVPPQKMMSEPGVEFCIERDPMEFRGAGGVLRDLAQEYGDNDLLLVANANQLCSEPLTQSIDRLMGGGDVQLLAGPHNEPTGLLVIRCGCLRQIPVSGFVDLKEQALPAIASRHSVHVVSSPSSFGHSIRRWSDYLAAIRRRHQAIEPPQSSAFQEDWKPLFSIVEEVARVDSTAGVHDSVVLAGGRVEAKATLVRSLVGPGGVVRRGEVVVDRLVTAAGREE